jgi:glycosyltransferase involved in cell wall biosynthesis
MLDRKFKIACFGFVKKRSGSMTSANFLMLKEFLERGYEIDLYGFEEETIDFQDLFKYKAFRYTFVSSKSFLSVYLSNKFKNILPDSIIYRLNYQFLKNEILTNHCFKKYDVLLFLGLFAPFKFENIPIISWGQGHPQTEWLYIKKLKEKIISLCGIGLYIKLTIFYKFKTIWARSDLGNSDLLICASQWSKQQLVKLGFNEKLIYILPYPLELEHFRPKNCQIDNKAEDIKTLLWLGRCDPRKRLDLLLEAYTEILETRQDLKLKIFGRISYAKGYKQLIDNFKFSDRIEYQLRVDCSEIPELMSQCDLLIQPSEGEDFGSSIAEALACGLPVIVGSTNGTKDYINSSSFLFEEYETEPLKNTIIKAIEAIEQNRKQLAIDARQAAEKNFNIVAVVDRFEEILQKTARKETKRLSLK